MKTHFTKLASRVFTTYFESLKIVTAAICAALIVLLFHGIIGMYRCHLRRMEIQESVYVRKQHMEQLEEDELFYMWMILLNFLTAAVAGWFLFN